MTRNINTNDDDEIEDSPDQNDQNADADAEPDRDAEQDGAEQDANGEAVDRFGGTGLTTSDLTELTPFDAKALSGMGDAEVAYLAEKTAQNHSTDGSREAYIDAITATLAQVEPDHEWADPAALRDHTNDMAELQRVARLIENSRGVSVVERAEGNEGPASDGTLANHRARQEQNAHANAASGAGNGVNTNANAGGGAPAFLRVGQRTVHHGEDAYYAEVRRRKKKGDWPHPEPSGYHAYRQRLEAKDDENSGV